MNNRKITDNFKVILAPSLEQAKSLSIPEASVEAEYGDYCVEGSLVTLAHHGSRSHNPAPCNTPNVPVLKSGTILVSHLDLDALGGIYSIMGIKLEAPEFWEGAEVVDVEGLHHIHELPQQVQDQLNAFYAFKDSINHPRFTEITDVTNQVFEYYDALVPILTSSHPDHEKVLQEGRKWEAASSAMVEAKLVKETSYVRCFRTDGIFCSAAYYSPNLACIIPATVSMNTAYHSITVGFADGGKNHSAGAIVQNLWGPEAGGRDGIAGSPRNWDISQEQLQTEFERCSIMVENMVKRVREKK